MFIFSHFYIFNSFVKGICYFYGMFLDIQMLFNYIKIKSFYKILFI